MPITIPFYNLVAENRELVQQFRLLFDRVLSSGRFVLGEELARFEQELARYLGVKLVIGVKSGTDALYFGLKWLGVGKGDEVITTPFTFPATIEAILRSGATPVLADIEPETLCLSPNSCQEVMTPRTKAVLLVHLFGNCGNLDWFNIFCLQHNLFLIEDSAQALGAEYKGRKLGSFGIVAGFSFYPTKNLGALGNGGAIATNQEPRTILPSARLDELQAGFLRLKLLQLDRWRARRRILAQRYEEALSPLVQIVGGADGCNPNYHQFAIRTPHREALRHFLLQEGIETKVYYSRPIHWQPEFRGLFSGKSLPEAEKASEEVLCLPIRQNLTDGEQEHIINSVIKFFGR